MGRVRWVCPKAGGFLVSILGVTLNSETQRRHRYPEARSVISCAFIPRPHGRHCVGLPPRAPCDALSVRVSHQVKTTLSAWPNQICSGRQQAAPLPSLQLAQSRVPANPVGRRQYLRTHPSVAWVLLASASPTRPEGVQQRAKRPRFVVHTHTPTTRHTTVSLT